MELVVGNAGTALLAMTVKPPPSRETSRRKLAGFRSGASSALISVNARTTRWPDGVIVKPALVSVEVQAFGGGGVIDARGREMVGGAVGGSRQYGVAWGHYCHC